tara:strand:- start:3431 stop:3805 length:375 start_codon:yes stop_codon:yes gene_type:complete
MKYISIIIFLIPNLLFANILDQFSLACICNKNLNALKYFDCKQKVSGTQLDYNNEKNSIFSTYDQKEYFIMESSDKSLKLLFETEDYSSTMLIDNKLELFFSILYKEYEKEWSYDLQCVSLKKE